MSESTARVPPGERRLSTGTPEVDRMLDGGLMPHRPYLLVGPSGTGKTTLALQFLCEGVRKGERALLVTVEEPPNEILWNHRALLPELGKVEVFDAIPDVMRFERTPFKDIASVRSSVPFDRVDHEIRKTPELTSVEVTISALEQMLRTEVQRKAYSRVAVDSLTALQYFCMKGYEPALGAQSFLRFLSDLRVTTILTVESPLEDVESPERMLARGEIRLFRWELDGVTVRAVGVEKFRGSSHDVRLHPYRIGGHGLDVNLSATISRDTQDVLATPSTDVEGTGEPPLRELSPVELLDQEIRDLLLVGVDLSSVRAEVEAALAAARGDEMTEAANHVTRALSAGAVPPDPKRLTHHTLPAPAEAALARILSRAEAVRVGVPPARLPEPPLLAAQLSRLLNEITLGLREVSERAPYPAPRPLPGVRAPAPAPAPTPIAPAPTVSPPTPAVSAPEPAPVQPTVAVPPRAPAASPVAPVPSPSPAPPAAPALAPPAPAPSAGPTTGPPTAPVMPSAPAPAPPSSPPPQPVPASPPAAPPPAAPAPPEAPSPAPAPAPVAPLTPPPPLPAPSAPTVSSGAPRVPSAPAPVPSPPSRGSPTEGARPAPPPAPPRPAPHARAEPPPLPTRAALPEAMLPEESRPIPPPPAHSGPDAPALQVPTPSAPVAASARPEPVAPPHEPAAPPTRRRKRAPAAARKKADQLGTPAPEPTAPSTVPSAAPTLEGAGPPPTEEAASPKPKRRLVRKKKAPPVVAATPGPVPAGVYGTEAPSAPPPDNAPPSEGS